MIQADLHDKGSRVVLWADSEEDDEKLIRTLERLPYVLSMCQGKHIISLYDLWLFKNFIKDELPCQLKISKQLLSRVKFLSGFGEELPELNLKRPLLPFHVDGVRFLTSRNALLADTMGLGKTGMSLAAAYTLMLRGEIKHAIFLVTKSTMHQWCEQIEIMFPEGEMDYVVVDGKAKDRIKIYKKKHKVYIVSLDTFKRDIKKLSPGHNKTLKAIWENSVVVVDEIDRIKNCKTIAARACYKIGRYAKYRWGLTGTPLDGKVENLYGVMRFLDKDFFVTKKHCLDYHAEYGYWGDIESYRNMDELHWKLKVLMIRRLKEDVWEQLPPKTYIEHRIDLSAEESKLYKEIKNQKAISFGEEMNDKINVALPMVVIMYGQSLLNTPALIDPTWTKPSTKMTELHGLLSELVMVSKVVVFTKSCRMCHILDKWLPWDSWTFTGELPIKERKRRQDDFLTNPETRVFIMDTAGARGIDLHGKDIDGVWHQGAEYLIRFDSLWNPAMNAQVDDRIHRIGQKERVTIIDFVTNGTVEEKIKKTLSTREGVNYQVVEGKIMGEEWQEIM